MSTASSTSPLASRPTNASVFRRRWNGPTLFNAAMNGVVVFISLIAVVPLFSVVYLVLTKGLAHFRLAMLWQLPPGAGMEGGGFGNALVGTLLIVAIAALVSIPVGVAAAIYLTELPGRQRSAHIVRFAAKTLSGLPSILAGVFVFETIVLTTNKFSLFAGALALAILMLPIITLAAEEALLRVPRALREASLALGATAAQTITQVVLPAARTSIMTGVSLAVARAAGETAPLIFTALFSDYWIGSFAEPTASLSVLIYNFSGVPYPNQLDIAWAASLVLILVVLITNVLTQLLAAPKNR